MNISLKSFSFEEVIIQASILLKALRSNVANTIVFIHLSGSCLPECSVFSSADISNKEITYTHSFKVINIDIIKQ